jgi:hypothetical protein
MKVVENRRLWSSSVKRYIQFNGDHLSFYPDRYRHLAPVETTTTSNYLGYSCYKCQGFICYNKPHRCREILDWEIEFIEIKKGKQTIWPCFFRAVKKTGWAIASHESKTKHTKRNKKL